MKLARRVVFLLIVGFALYGSPNDTTFAACNVSIQGEGNCGQMWYEISGITGYAGSCIDYCDYIPACNPDAAYCWEAWYDPWYCEDGPFGQGTWYCNCECMYS